MYFSTETLLAIAIVGFYSYDSVGLVRYDQYILHNSFMGSYVSFPSRRFQLSGKFLFLYKLLNPFDLISYFKWPTFEKRLNKKEVVLYKDLISELLPLQILTTVLFVLLTIAVASLLFFQDANLFLFLFVSVYSICLAIAIFVFLSRKVFNLSNKECISLIVDAIACPPFAINIPRKIFVRQEVTKTPLKFVHQVLSEKKLKDFRENLLMKISEFESENDLSKEQVDSLKKYKNEVEKIGRI